MSLIIHHLRRSQSERIVWLCEELIALDPSFRYELVKHDRDATSALAPASLKDLSSAKTAPVMIDSTVDPPVILAESQAIVEYIVHIHGNGKFVLRPGSPDYVHYLSWYNFANGSLQPGLTRLGTVDLVLKAASRIEAERQGGAASTPEQDKKAEMDRKDVANPLIAMVKARLDNHLDMLNVRLGEARYLAGEDFTTADIMMVFSLTTMRGFYPYSLKEYANILRYLDMVAKRPAYVAAFHKAEPGLEPLIGAEAELFDFAVFK